MGFREEDVEHMEYLNLRYEGTDTQIMVQKPEEEGERKKGYIE